MAGPLGEIPGAGQVGPHERRPAILPFTERADGFLEATPFLGKVYNPSRFALHGIKFHDLSWGTGRTDIGEDNSVYYADPEIQLLPGVAVIHGALQTASLIAMQNRTGVVPVWREAEFQQGKPAPLGKFVDFNTIVEEHNGELKAIVEIRNSKGKVIALTTGIEGRLEELHDTSEEVDAKAHTELWLPNGFQRAEPLLEPIYHPSKAVIHGIKFDSGWTGTGLVNAGVDDYYIGGHRHGEIPEIVLVHAAMQTATLISTQGSEPGSRLPLYAGGSFHRLSDGRVGPFIQIAAEVEIDKTDLLAEADILSPDGEKIAHISNITALIGAPPRIKTLLRWISREQ